MQHAIVIGSLPLLGKQLIRASQAGGSERGRASNRTGGCGCQGLFSLTKSEHPVSAFLSCLSAAFSGFCCPDMLWIALKWLKAR
tara:strand:- start:11273 stop:11524 length:252 start_codon:yes stop_codon:yes gene_type:complete